VKASSQQQYEATLLMSTFYNIFSYIMTTSFSGGGSRSIQREPPTMGKQLVNFITCGLSNIIDVMVSH
jgi:hypothetical protein